MTPVGSGKARRLTRDLAAGTGVLPFLGYTALFLLLPTGLVVVQSFTAPDGRPTLGNVAALLQPVVLGAFWNSLVLSLASALAGALLGALLSWVVVSGRPDGLLRRVVTSACGVLAQFGGITLAFAFIVTVGAQGLLTILLRDLGASPQTGWLYAMPGLVVIYTYFQIPLMVLTFTPALDGVRPQWREACETLGGTAWDYLRHVAVPILTPPFLGSFLLLFANAFAAYATAAALVSQGAVIVPLQIRTALTSEVVLGQENVGKALALGMVVVVAAVMGLYALVQRRSARWLG
ncbi:ABC transporter permease subunit [Streptomyces sp. NP160]|uniref:ABC transporter permease n=1 Tax=Streptomyces sp. NP160 TaxID=2586637 RepID=UPI00111A14AB|nr:ABC transporter permease subunit [Streptomyces sp. NP160]TNM59966.1 ABC transporter permease subunit [Streptomyces sp. NP160]